MKRLFKLIILILICLFSLTSCLELINDAYNAFDKNSQYYKGTGWDCDAESFKVRYYELYESKIRQLISQYGLDAQFDMFIEDLGDGDSKVIVWIHLYTEEYTYRFRFANIGWVGHYDAELYCYDIKNKNDDYSKLAHLVDVINDFTDYVAYDTKTEANRFESLFSEALQTDVGFASDVYHEDSLIGSVGYIINLNYNGGYYYMMEENDELDLNCHRFEFKGLLKPLEISEE